MNGETAGEKVLLTGGTGFLGSAVLDKLIARNVKPAVIARVASKEFLDRYETKINLFKIDLLDERALKALFEDFPPDKIIHLAGSTGKSSKHADDLKRINYTATVNLMELARKARVKKIIITGTADEYGAQPAPQNEKMPAQPVSPYALSKHKAVTHALSLYEKYRLPVVIVRPFSIYGDRQPASMFIAQAVECAVKNVPFEMSEGFQKRDLLFVEDLADVMIKALTAKNIDGKIFNAGSGAAYALRDVAQRIWRIAEADTANLKIGARQTVGSELYDTQADISKIKKFFDWQPQTSLDEGLQIIIENARVKV